MPMTTSQSPVAPLINFCWVAWVIAGPPLETSLQIARDGTGVKVCGVFGWPRASPGSRPAGGPLTA
jgi:hypothetical protein